MKRRLVVVVLLLSSKTSGLAITTSDEYKVLVANRCDAAALAPASCTDLWRIR
jgi:hypothetical protein